ncbi:hypothetical protein JHK82_047756 [Glycine max]|uniref:Secreted protein n=1 Tax=Glycine max TaxID=3847 RepID=K7MM21_SOYBN|nr:hypothetical protein JHK86_047642 [Glycine max]KAG4943612.1 hypothetical protein JHK85_048258 [Glycine max]KAG5097902.1 hypothetical protein JHK82_047756 [Glycine max]KAG5102699.1 hypothetical protein JHK84_047668 [Glycine max]KRH04525.1 hypothetical protein GLYMA_17G167300v4 [Glycine max]
MSRFIFLVSSLTSLLNSQKLRIEVTWIKKLSRRSLSTCLETPTKVHSKGAIMLWILRKHVCTRSQRCHFPCNVSEMRICSRPW